VSPTSQFFYRYNLWNLDRFNPFDPFIDPTNVPGFGSFNDDTGQSLGAGWTWTLGPRTVNEFRFGLNRLRAGIFHEHRGDDVSASLGIGGLITDSSKAGRPGIVVGITDSLEEPYNLPQEREGTTLQFTNALSWQIERHSFKVGVDYRRFSLGFFLDLYARGGFTFVGLSGNPIADLLMGVPFVALRQSPSKDTVTAMRTKLFSTYFQDDWKVTSDLTLNLGVRYEYNQPAYDAEDRLSFPDLENPAGGFIRNGTAGVPRGGYDSDWNNVAPRIGVAWKPWHDERTVVRGGYGIFNDIGILNANVLPRFNPPQYALDLFVGPRPLTNAFAGEAASVPVANGIDRDYRDGYYHHYSVGVQREVRPDLLIELSYLGSRGRDLAVFLDRNQGRPGGPPVRNPNFGPAQIAVAAGHSSYDSLQLRLERRFVNGLSFLNAYTWSRSRDIASGLFGARASNGVPQNSFDPEADWGPSDFDTPHRYVLSWIWQLPVGSGRRFLATPSVASAILGGFEVTGIVTLQSGRPFSVFYGSSANYSGTSNGSNGGLGRDRPNQVGDPNVGDPGPDQWFNTAAFQPPTGTFGSLARNTLRGDGFNNIDLGLYRGFRLGQAAVQCRLEVFNVLNTPFFFLPVGDLTNSSAGRVVRAGDARQIQLGIKVSF
jgi:hypothetical protein